MTVTGKSTVSSEAVGSRLTETLLFGISIVMAMSFMFAVKVAPADEFAETLWLPTPTTPQKTATRIRIPSVEMKCFRPRALYIYIYIYRSEFYLKN